MPNSIFLLRRNLCLPRRGGKKGRHRLNAAGRILYYQGSVRTSSDTHILRDVCWWTENRNPEGGLTSWDLFLKKDERRGNRSVSDVRICLRLWGTDGMFPHKPCSQRGWWCPTESSCLKSFVPLGRFSPAGNTATDVFRATHPNTRHQKPPMLQAPPSLLL